MITPANRQLAYAPESLAKRKATFAKRVRLRKEDVRRLRNGELVPLGIADLLGLKSVARYLRELKRKEQLNPFLLISVSDLRQRFFRTGGRVCTF